MVNALCNVPVSTILHIMTQYLGSVHVYLCVCVNECLVHMCVVQRHVIGLRRLTLQSLRGY